MANSIILGNDNISAFKVGVNNVDYIYLGTTLVYQSHNYSASYLTFVAQESGTFKFSGSSTANTVSYSLDNGETWTSLASNTDSPTVNSGETIMWKASGLTASSSYGIGNFSSTGAFEVEGNIMSLLYGDDFAGQTSISDRSYTFLSLFEGCTGLTSAENLVLPITLGTWCYAYMFNGCTSLTTAPQLKSTTLESYSYYNMFSGCTSLSAITCLANDISSTNCTNNWVGNVSSNGVFTKNGSMSGWTSGANGIPTNWTVEDFPTKNRTTSGTSYCGGSTGTDKLIDVYNQVSYDDGQTWTTTATTPTIIEEKSADCGYAERSVSGTPYCDGGSKVVDVDFQESYDSGSTWVTVSSSTTTVERCSSDCGCSGCTDMFCGVDINGNDYIVSDDGTGVLKQSAFTDAVAEGNVGDATTTLGEYCFQNIASTLSALTISDTVTEFGHECFMETTHIETLTIPSGVTFLGYWCFTRMSGLHEIIFEGSAPTVDWGAPFHEFYPSVIYVPDAYVSDYRALGATFCDATGYDAYTVIQPISNKT